MWETLHASMLHWYRLIGAGSQGARTVERDGVVAALVPASRQRSVVNAVVYERPEALAAAYDEIAAAYAEIGAKWTVWVHDRDAETAALLERAGHVLDAAPEAMAADLVATPPARPPDGALADWTAEGDLADVGAINDRAYGFGGDWFSRALTRCPAARSTSTWRARTARRSAAAPPSTPAPTPRSRWWRWCRRRAARGCPAS